MKIRSLLLSLTISSALTLAACSSGQDTASTQQAAPEAAPSPDASGINQALTADQVNVHLSQQGAAAVSPDGKDIAVTVDLGNSGKVALSSTGKYPVHLGAHSMAADGKVIENDLARANIPIIAPGGSAQVTILLPIDKTLNYSVQLLPVQEQVTWFDSLGTKPLVVGPFLSCSESDAGKVCGANGKPLAQLPAK
ncbi:MAG: hypothetical protein WC617_10765 [Rhodanobacter sp.]|jgi:hypothetical protein